MAVIWGGLGTVNGVSTVGEWLVDYFGEPPPLIAANTQGGEASACGPTDWSGFYRAYGHTPAAFPGQALTFTGNVTNSSKGATGTAIVDEIDIVGNIEAVAPFQYTVKFSRNGALTLGELGSTPADATAPNIVCPASMYVYMNAAITDTRFWRLIIRSNNEKYIDSETSGAWKRVAKELSGQFLYRTFFSDPSVLPTLLGNYTGRFYVTGSTFWLLEWSKIIQIKNIGGGGERKELVGADVIGSFNAHNGTAIGAITAPSLKTKWPTYQAEA